jgi:hypothetical protein
MTLSQRVTSELRHGLDNPAYDEFRTWLYFVEQPYWVPIPETSLDQWDE